MSTEVTPPGRKFTDLPEDFRIGSVIADGMWYNLPKWKKIAKASDEGMAKWIEEHLADGSLVQSETGAKSYRFPLESIIQWHEENNIKLGTRLIEGFFPPRIWCGMTETEGFLASPRREVAIVSFDCSVQVAAIITERLRGIARVREVEPGKYKAYCLHAKYAKNIIANAFKEQPKRETGRIYSRALNDRRELVDFPPEFRHELVVFYTHFAKTLTRRSIDTINIFIPDADAQEQQFAIWVCEAAEKFDEKEATPFSGYLDEVLRYWPYNLPHLHLGKQLSDFQRHRASAVKALRKKLPDRTDYTMKEIAEQMEMPLDEFVSFEEKHRVWLSSRSSTTLTWEENSEEKMGRDFLAAPDGSSVSASNPNLAHRLSVAVLKAALDTDNYEDAYAIIAQIDNGDVNVAKVKEASEIFVQSLGDHMGL